MTLAIEATDISVRAGAKRILGPLSLEVTEGSHVLIVGRSGCGKTSLLRAIAGLATLDGGRLSLFGKLATDGARQRIEPSRREIGMLFQGAALWPHMSAAGNLMFVLRRRGASRAEARRRAGELLELVELAGYQKRMPATLSGGEAQRLGLARALAGEPRILLLDEPLGPLDAELRAELLARLREVDQRLGLTVLHVTHDPTEAAALADRTLRMVEGRWAEDSSSPVPQPRGSKR